MEPTTFQAALDVLAHGEVHPLLLATDVEPQEGLTVTVVLIDPAHGVEAGGHTSTLPVFSLRFAGEGGADDALLHRRRSETVTALAARLREVLAGG